MASRPWCEWYSEADDSSQWSQPLRGVRIADRRRGAAIRLSDCSGDCRIITNLKLQSSCPLGNQIVEGSCDDTTDKPSYRIKDW